MVSLREVAELAAVAPSTVSRVVNNAPNIAPETAAVVQKAIQQLGYKPRSPGRPLHGAGMPASPRRSNRIALLVAGMPRSMMNAPVYMDVIHGVEAALAEAGKVMVLRHLPPGSGDNGMVFQQKMDGAVVFGSVSRDTVLAQQLQDIPCVRVMSISDEGEGDHVTLANRRIGKIAAESLLKRGHRRLAIILQTPKPHTFSERLETFRDKVAESGGSCLEIMDDDILQDAGDVLSVPPAVMHNVFEQMLSGPSDARPTGVFLTADVLAPAFYNEMQRRGLIPGRDLDIVSCNNEKPLLAHLHPRPATIDIHAEQVGRKAVEQLLWRIEHPDEPRTTIALEPTLVRPGEGDGGEGRVRGTGAGESSGSSDSRVFAGATRAESHS